MKKLQGGSPELFQWTIIAFTVLIVATLTVNAIRLQTTTRDLAKKVDALQTAQQAAPTENAAPTGGIVANVPVNQNTNIPAAAPIVAPNVVTIPGTTASITLPGAWKQTQNSGYLAFSVAPNADLSITKMTIGDQDLQQWFLKQYPLNDVFATRAVADANAAGMHVTRADIRIFGPNQVSVAGNLAMDVTVSYKKQFSEENSLVQTQRFVAVRRGGDVIVLELTAPTVEADAVMPVFDQVLQSLSFAS